MTKDERAAYDRMHVELARLRDEATALRNSLWDLLDAVEDLRFALDHAEPIPVVLLRAICDAAGAYRKTLEDSEPCT